ncbi:MAG TPA: DMT family transporter [Spirochaetia bacterium]|nr:DMT family transporter [Spirochaetia bacterium]
MAILLAGLSAIMYGAGDFCGGMATRRTALPAVLVVSQGVGLAIAVAAAVLLGMRVVSATDLLWGVVAGVCGTAGIAALYAALASTVVAVASPLAAVTGAVLPVLLGVASGERPGALGWAGIALGIAAIVLLTRTPSGSGSPLLVRRAAMLGSAAGIGFGLFFFAISRTSHESGIWPLVAARGATISLVLLYAVLRRAPLRVSRAGLPMVLSSGALDMGANIAFLLASRLGMLSISAVVAALYPAPTVILAWIILKERMNAPRVAGLVLAVAGVALLSS